MNRYLDISLATLLVPPLRSERLRLVQEVCHNVRKLRRGCISFKIPTFRESLLFTYGHNPAAIQIDFFVLCFDSTSNQKHKHQELETIWVQEVARNIRKCCF